MTPGQVLQDVFGYTGFRPGQKEVVARLLQGKDCMCIMPTGGGKSLCYQVPALVLPGITLVVSPLISLMKDQVGALVQAGVRAAYLNSSLTPRQLQLAMQRARDGWYRIIYVSPERLMTPAFLSLCAALTISMVAVDEAHCVSQWGQDFRPEYRQIPAFLRTLPRRPVVGAFTATATPQVQRDIRKWLELRDPFCMTTGFDRSNLRFFVESPRDKKAALLRFLRPRKRQSGIIYCATRKNVEDITEFLRDNGYPAVRYHAGLEPEERTKSQEDFLFDRAPLIVATNAFGMGIDKSNVSFVVHYNMPQSLEAYYQEAGRAGRDGNRADCLLLYGKSDVMTARFLIEHREESENAFPLSPEEREEARQKDLEKLRQMTFYSTTHTCLRRFILRYFGQEYVPENCGGCSVCLSLPRDSAAAPARVSAPSRRRGILQGDGTDVDPALLEELKKVRLSFARRLGVPAFTIFTDATLLDMCRQRPQTPQELRQVSGVGESKLRRFGDAFLRVLTSRL